VTAIVSGKEQEWLELEAAACGYEENLLPPFFDTLTQYVEMDNSTFACPGHQHGAFFKKHPAGRQFLTSLVKTSFAPTCATPTLSLAIC
jgi:ornithine decarboxylase